MISTTQAPAAAPTERAETHWTPPRWWFIAPRIANGAFFAGLAAIVAVPGLDESTRDLLAAGLLIPFAAFFAALWLIARRGSGRR
ncbi:Uncharacterised protein [Mycobacterium tuberculosis]|nr:Uncharacterised protein [Mycobacterium tuberculosis]